jgi:hypothetical protein
VSKGSSILLAVISRLRVVPERPRMPRDADDCPIRRGAALAVEADDETTEVVSVRPFAMPRGFPGFAGAPRGNQVRACGPDRLNLTGSPLDPSAERVIPLPASPGEAQPLLGTPAAVIGLPPPDGAARCRVDIIVPVYGGLAHTLACLETVSA